MVDLTTYDKMLKDVYLPPVLTVINTKTVLMKRLRRIQKLVGRKGLIPLRKTAHSGVGAREANAVLPTGGSSGWENATVGVKRMYGVVKFDGIVFDATKSKEGAFAPAASTEMKFLAEDVKNDVNRQLFGDGSGYICKLDGNAAAVHNADVAKTLWSPATKYALHGRLISVTDTDFTTVHNFTGAVAYAAIDQADAAFTNTALHLLSTETFTVNMDDGDYVSYYGNGLDGAVQREMDGLRAWVSNANRLAQADSAVYNVGGLGTTANPWWKCGLDDNSGTLRPVNFGLIQKGFDWVEVDQGGEVTLMVTTAAVRNHILDLFRADRRFVKEGKLEGGFPYIEINGKPLVVDKDCTYADIYFLDEGHIAIYRMADFQWMDRHGSILTKVASYDQYEAVLYSYMNMGANRTRHYRINDCQGI